MLTKKYLQEELARRIKGIRPNVPTNTDVLIGELKSALMMVDCLPDDDSDKKYNEALERANELLLGNEHSNTIRSYFEHIFPELRESESEDERIRKEIKDIVLSYRNNCVYEGNHHFDECLDWLEKQKELPFVKDVVLGYPGLYYYDGERMHFRGSPAMEEKQKELMPPVNVDPCDASCDAYYQRGLNKGYELGLEAGRKEQKPISTEDMPYIADEHFFEREPADSFKYKLAEYMTKCCTKKEGPYGYEYGISAGSILQMAKEELIKRGIVQKPAEWSEFDKGVLKDAICAADILGNDESFNKGNPNLGKAFRVAKDWLKSLPERFNLQPKQEWSEVDEKNLELVTDCVYEFYPDPVMKYKLKDWLTQRFKFIHPSKK